MSFKWPETFNKKGHRAYILFHDDYTYFLTAWNKFHEMGHWSGLGGGREPFETDTRHTLIRELMEELFGWKYNHNLKIFTNPVSRQKIRAKKIFDLCLEKIDFTENNKINIRIFYVTFDELNKILKSLYRIVSEIEMDSPFYTLFPKNMDDLIHKRVKRITGEIGELRIVSIPRLNRMRNVDQYFKDDIKSLQNRHT